MNDTHPEGMKIHGYVVEHLIGGTWFVLIESFTRILNYAEDRVALKQKHNVGRRYRITRLFAYTSEVE